MMSPTDLHLARRLHEYARHCFNLSSGALGQSSRLGTCLAASMLAEAMHFSLLGLIASAVPIEEDLNERPQSLTHLARAVSAAGVHAFEAFEMETLAYLDVIHTAPVTKVLLPDEVARSIYSHAQGLVDRITRTLYDRIQQQEGRTS